MNSYKELEVWQKSMDLCMLIYQATNHFPQDEKYSLTSQMRRSAVSIPSNIAEGWGRNNKKEYIQFLRISRGSCLELETQVELSFRLKYLDEKSSADIQHSLESILMMMNKLISRLRQP
jgi:four helix bundle protein